MKIKAVKVPKGMEQRMKIGKVYEVEESTGRACIANGAAVEAGKESTTTTQAKKPAKKKANK